MLQKIEVFFVLTGRKLLAVSSFVIVLSYFCIWVAATFVYDKVLVGKESWNMTVRGKKKLV